MVVPAHGFACDGCGRPLSAARVRQGVRRHKECREHKDCRELRADPELRELFALAAEQARALALDLEKLRALRTAEGRQ